jgi:hypothetical protein
MVALSRERLSNNQIRIQYEKKMTEKSQSTPKGTKQCILDPGGSESLPIETDLTT